MKEPENKIETTTLPDGRVSVGSPEVGYTSVPSTKMRTFETGAKTIPDFPDYTITQDGRVWSKKTHRYLKYGYTLDGYLKARLYSKKYNHGYPASVARLVLLTYVGPPKKNQQCRHLNGDKKDNRLSNLAWGTHSQNQIDNIYSRSHSNLKLWPQQVRQIIYLLKTKLFLQRQIADLYGVNTTTINDINTKKTWRHIWTR